MSEKDLKVLSPCVDIRNGKRFGIGDTFDPVPTEEQATRLFKAGCLPEGAIKLGKAADVALEGRAEGEAKKRRAAETKNAKIAVAVDADTNAKQELAEAEALVAAATTDEEKAAAAVGLDAAKVAADKAAVDLAAAIK